MPHAAPSFWAFFGALCAMFVEVLFRLDAGSAYLTLRHVPAILGAFGVNYSIYRLLQGETIIGAIVWFSFATASLRIVATFVVSDPVPRGNVIAWVLMGAATAAKIWL